MSEFQKGGGGAVVWSGCMRVLGGGGGGEVEPEKWWRGSGVVWSGSV